MVEQSATGDHSSNVTPIRTGTRVGGGSGGGDSSGGSGGDYSGITVKDYINAQDEKTRAQNDEQFTRIATAMDNLKVPSIWQIAGLLVAGIGFTFAILAYASDRFDGGLAAGSVRDATIEALLQRDNEQDQKLDEIIQIVERIRDNPQGSPSEGQN